MTQNSRVSVVSLQQSRPQTCWRSSQVDNSAPRLTDIVQALSVLDKAGEYYSGRVLKLRIIFGVPSRVETLSLLVCFVFFQ